MSDNEHSTGGTYRCDKHDVTTNSRRLMRLHLDDEHPGSHVDVYVDEYLDDSHRPQWDETPVTLSLIEQLLDAHPDYRIVQHVTPLGNRVTMIEEYDEGPTSGLAGEFVSLVSEAGDCDGD